ncbi:hypothetical protein BDV93DRAFT_567341 [Ceratobasidium sp. AG-I]|nr:hypothetical protein BDV93DRAFT_567341 [Ceratobasidium sp. AG-I]
MDHADDHANTTPMHAANSEILLDDAASPMPAPEQPAVSAQVVVLVNALVNAPALAQAPVPIVMVGPALVPDAPAQDDESPLKGSFLGLHLVSGDVG